MSIEQKPNKVWLMRNLDGNFAANVLQGSRRAALKSARKASGMTTRQLRAAGWVPVRLHRGTFEL